MWKRLGISEKGIQRINYIRAGIERGWSANRTLMFLREHGLGYRRQEFLRDFRILRGIKERADAMKYTPKRKVISERHYQSVRKIGWGRFGTIMKVEAWDRNLEDYVEFKITIYHDTLLSPAELYDIAKAKIEGDSPRFRVLKTTPIGGWKYEAL